MSEELKTYDFPVDHGDFTTTTELFYLKPEVDAVLAENDKEICKLQRALWLARAECAKWKSCYYWYAVSRKHDSRMYDEVERKCRAKAEEYK